MKKSVIYVMVVAGASALTFTLLNRDMRHRYATKIKDVSHTLKLKHKSDFPIEEAGHPSIDQLDNSDMVFEGSQFGVDYYNKVKQ